MKSINILYAFFIFLYCLCSCKEIEKNKKLEPHNNTLVLPDTVNIINKIDSSKIQNTLDFDKEKLIELFFNSFSKDNYPSYVIFDQVKKNHNWIKVKKYSELNINGTIYPTYIFSFPYENDAPYQSILLTNTKHDDGLVLFEKVINEGEYLRTSTFSENKIKNTEYEIEYYEYDNDGNIIGEKIKKDSIIINSNIFEINDKKIQLYSPKRTNKTTQINNKWFGKYKVWFDYGEIGGLNAGWDLEIKIDKDSITATGNGYQISFKDELLSFENKNKLILEYKKNIDGYTLGEKMKPEFLLIEDNGKYYIKSKWIDSDVLTQQKKNGYEIKKIK